MAKRRWLLTVCVCLLIFAGLATYKFLQVRAAVAFADSYPEPSETVEADRATAGPVTEYVTALGEVIAPQSIALRNELAGRISAVNFQSGDTVKQGAILLQLDTSEERASLRAAQARADLAQLDLQRVQNLLRNKTVSQERVDQARAEQQIALANISAIEAVIDKKTLRAPFAARTGLHQLEVGEYLQNNTLITTLIGVNGYSWVDFNLPVAGAIPAIGAQVLVSPAGESQQQLRGHIIARDTAVSTSSRNLRFRARLEHQLTPNSVVNVAAAIRQLQRIQVPVTALRRDTMGDYVFALRLESSPNNYRARRQAVTVGEQHDQMVSILNGLQAGDLIATQGAFKLRPDLLVHIRERSSASSPTQTAE